LEKERANNVVDGSDRTLGLAVLWRSIGTREAHRGAMMEKKRAILSAVKLAAIVALERANGGAKMSLNVGMKVAKNSGYIRFQFEGKGPEKMGEII
jgi:hypothetical protein